MPESGHVDDIDGMVECVLARVGLDGLAERNPLAVIYALRWTVEPLPLGERHGQVITARRAVLATFLGDDRAIHRTLAHEAGHVVLVEAGHALPHCECCADRAGRAVVLGRRPLQRRLRIEPGYRITQDYAHRICSTLVSQRIAEVRWEAGRLVG